MPVHARCAERSHLASCGLHALWLFAASYPDGSLYVWQAVVHGVGFFVFSTVLDVRFVPAETLKQVERFGSNIFGVNAPHAVTHRHLPHIVSPLTCTFLFRLQNCRVAMHENWFV